MPKIIIYFFILTITFSNLNFSFAQQNQNEFKNLCNFLRNLKIGSKGEDVKCLQQYLKELNLLKYKPTGYYGFLTRKAVLKWQKMNGLKQTGIFDFNSRIKYYSTYHSLQKLELKKQTENSTFDEVSTNLFLSSIEDKDIIIDENGFKSFDKYFENFNLRIINLEDYRNIFQKMFVYTLVGTTTVIDTEKSLFDVNESLLPGVFIENNLKFNLEEKEKLQEKAFLLKEMIKLQLEERKKIPVHSNLKELHKLFIFTDSLGVEILNKYLDYLNNRITEKEIQIYLNEYNKEIEEKRKFLEDEILKILGLKSLLNTIYYKFLSNLFFFLPKEVLALPFNLNTFGGRILFVFYCPCSFGYLVRIGVPKPATLFVPNSFLTSPLLFKYKKILSVGVWTLGLYFKGVNLPCLIPVPYGCAPIGWGNLIFEAGTGARP